MIQFLIKGLLRERNRSLFPILIIAAGVFITVTGYGWINGASGMFMDTGARFDAGHLKIMTRAYAAEADQVPIDLALMDVAELQEKLKQDFPEITWTPRIKFGGLLDVADEFGETANQGTVAGLALDLFNPDGFDRKLLDLDKAIVRGRLPENPDEILISDELAQTLNIKPGMSATLLGGTMHGSMAVYNFTVSGTVLFGVKAMDRGAVLADIKGIQNALDMPNACSELLGYFPNLIFNEDDAYQVKEKFNAFYENSTDEFSPAMVTLLDQNDLDSMMNYMDSVGIVMIAVFVFIMSLVLWNAGLMASLRRYGELGVRLAIGESKSHIFRSLLSEALVVGLVGSILGTLLGVAMTYYLQVVGIDISASMDRFTLFVPNVMRARVTPMCYFVGFIPGCIAMVLGTAFAGLGIFKRQTAQLFKELEA